MIYLAIPNNIQQRNNIWASREVLQDLNFSLYLLLFHRLKDFDNAFLIIDDIYAFEDLRVLPTAYSDVKISKRSLRVKSRRD